jgi:hypothetical protein
VKLDKTSAKLIHGRDHGGNYVEATPAERVSMVWELTKEVWSIKDRESVERPMGRDIATLIKEPRQ